MSTFTSTSPYEVTAQKPAARVTKGPGLFGRLMARLMEARRRQAMLELRRHGLYLPSEMEAAGRKINERNEDSLPFMQPSSMVSVLFVDDRAAGIDLPASVVLEVTETEPGVKGDTVSNVTKPATLETGAVVQVPLFVNVGDKIKVDPREKRYIGRAN